MASIYPSERVLPYVYMGTHKTTGQFYIGYRSANKKPSHLDLGTQYFTSSKKVKQLGFDSFNWAIMVEFFDGKDAYNFEQDLILACWEDPLKLNGYCDKIGKFTMVGTKASAETKRKQSKAKKGRTKETDPCLAARSAKMVGRTKETHPGVAAQSAKMVGRTKETHPGVAAQSAKIKGRTKENDTGVAAMAEKLTTLSPEQRKLLVEMRGSGMFFKDIHLYFTDNCGVKIGFNAICVTYRREIKAF